jgi:alpha/beta superfamily hydrolase
MQNPVSVPRFPGSVATGAYTSRHIGVRPHTRADAGYCVCEFRLHDSLRQDCAAPELSLDRHPHSGATCAARRNGHAPRAKLADIRYAPNMTELTARSPMERLTIPGPVGDLETLVELPGEVAAGDVTQVGVVCHPHPLHGGTMTNKVAHMLAKSFNAAGMVAVRFNFRGVGASAGAYAEGNGETLDALAVIDWAQARWPNARIAVAGFSFGGAVAICAASARPVHRLITVAPAVDRVDVSTAQLPQCPWLVVQGEADEVVAADHVRAWMEALPQVPELAFLPDIGHYFHGRLNDLKRVVLEWLARQEQR